MHVKASVEHKHVFSASGKLSKHCIYNKLEGLWFTFTVKLDIDQYAIFWTDIYTDIEWGKKTLDWTNLPIHANILHVLFCNNASNEVSEYL